MSSQFQVPTGTRDIGEDTIALYDRIRRIADEVYKKYGSKAIDTPVIERTDIVQSLYGECFDKEVFWVGEEKSYFLRYDLTLPSARYVGNHGLVNFRRHQFGKVYRNDAPNFEHGRYREFVQCDFDIYGTDGGSQIYDAEMLSAAIEVLDYIGLPYRFYLNDRRWLYSLVLKSGVSEEMIKPVCSTLDKMDKKTIDEIVSELTYERMLPDDVVSSLQEMIKNIQSLKSNEEVLYLMQENGIDTVEMKRLLFRIGTMRVCLNPLLARGLDYYTGIIYEIVEPSTGITFASGGRYDNMVERFSSHVKIPAIGFSIGVDRVVNLYQKLKPDTRSELEFEILVGSAGQWKRYDSIDERFKLMTMLRKEGFRVTTMTNQKPKMKGQLETCFAKNIPVMVLIGENEVDANTANVKDIRKEIEYVGVPFDDVPSKVREILNLMN